MAWGAKKVPTHSTKQAPEEAVSGEDGDVLPNVAEEEATTVSDTAAANVDKTGRPFPWYGSLKKSEVNVRSGPGVKYPILWVYMRPGYPVQVLTRYDNYYKLRDVEGEEGWTYIGMVSKKVTGLVGGQDPANLYHKEDTTSRVVARLAPGVIVDMESCTTSVTPTLCKVETNGYKGWIAKERLEMTE
jgi:SH3-like domain-containing protein